MKNLFRIICRIASSTILILICTVKLSFAQGSSVTAQIKVDTSNKNFPLLLSFEQNTRKDIHSVRIIAIASTKFAAFLADSTKAFVVPQSDILLEISALPDTAMFPTGNNIPIVRLLTDSTTRQQSFSVEFLNRNEQTVYSQTVSVSVGFKVRLGDPCSASYIDFRSGRYRAVGSPDSRWVLVSAPSNYSAPPHPAIVIVNNYFPSGEASQWIGATETSSNSASTDPPGEYIYRRTFCVSSSGYVRLYFKIAADDKVSVYLNGFVYSKSAPASQAWWPQTSYTFGNGWNLFYPPVNAGINYIEVRVTNLGSGQNASGFRFDGIVEDAYTYVIMKDECCIANGAIFGHKYWDKNCNGVKDDGESGVSGWSVTASLSTGGIINTTTDANGYYAFAGLPPGSYTVSETTASGWTPSVSSGPYTVNVTAGSLDQRDFLNCKTPACTDLFSDLELSDACCSGTFHISNGNSGAALQSLSYVVTGGVINSISSSPCTTTSTQNVNGTTSGSQAYSTSCTAANVENIQFNATATNATGQVCVMWTATFKLGASTFSCSKQMCIQCERMPQDCGHTMSVGPNDFLYAAGDYRSFVIQNTKLPLSRISSVDIAFDPEPVPYHFGYSTLYVDPFTTGGPRPWAYPYTKIQMGCIGPDINGAAANNLIIFTVGVDNTVTYSGTVHIAIGYCDGDTCKYDYLWNPAITNSVSNKIVPLAVPAAVRIFGLTLTPPDSTASFSIKLKDATASILAVTAPTPDSGNLYGAKVLSARNTVQYRWIDTDPRWPGLASGKVYIVYTPGKDTTQTVIVRYFDANGREIGQGEKQIAGTKLAVDPQPSVVPGNGDVTINSVIPNPSSGTLTVGYTLAESQDARLELFNTLGQSVAVLADGLQEKGLNEIKYNVTALAEGTYFLRLSTRSGTASAIVKVIH